MDISNIQINSDQDYILFSVGTYKLFLAHDKEGMDALTVYMHLFFTARIQKTNQVKANSRYIQKGTKLGEIKVKKAKKMLREFGLIEYIRDKPRKGNPYLGEVYIKLNTIPNQEIMNKILSTGMESTPVDINTSCSKGIKCLNEKNKCLNEKNKIDSLSETIHPIFNKRFIHLCKYWNSSSTLKKIKTDELDHPILNKKIQRAYKIINLLLSGEFGRWATGFSSNQEFIENNNVAPECLNGKKRTIRQIEEVIDRFFLQLEEGYWPYESDQKEKLKKIPFDDFLYSPNNSKCPSIFLKLESNPPRKLSSIKSEVVECKDEKDYQAFKKLFETEIFCYQLSESEQNKLKRSVNLLIDEYEEIQKNGYDCLDEKEARYNFGSREALFSNYLEWLEGRNNFLKKEYSNTIKIEMIKPFTKTWNAFIEYMKQTHGVKVYA